LIGLEKFSIQQTMPEGKKFSSGIFAIYKGKKGFAYSGKGEKNVIKW